MGFLVASEPSEKGFFVPTRAFEALERALARFAVRMPRELHDAHEVIAAEGAIAKLRAAGFEAKLDDEGNVTDLAYFADKVPSGASERWPEPLVDLLATHARTHSTLRLWFSEEPEVIRSYRVGPKRLSVDRGMPTAFRFEVPLDTTVTYEPGLVVEIPLRIVAEPVRYELPFVTVTHFAYGQTTPALTIAESRVAVPSEQVLVVRFDTSMSVEEFRADVDAWRKEQHKRFGPRRLVGKPKRSREYPFRLQAAQDPPRGAGVPMPQERMQDIVTHAQYADT